jgi:3',5'-cyclic AMP phosphodiesterase CpdA
MKLSRREFIAWTAALGLSSCARVKVPLISGGGKGPFTVAAMNDLHVKDAGSTALVNRAIEKINATPGLRFTVVLGDLSTDGKLSELNLAKGSLGRLVKPYLVLPGNHDVQANDANIFAIFEKVFGQTQWVREEDNWVFIGINSCEGASSDVTIPDDRMTWLRKEIKRVNPKRPVALFAHHPFNPLSKEYRVKNADEVIGLFSGHNLKLVAAGHWHGNQVEEQNGILFTTTACCSSTRANADDTQQKGYRLFRFDADSVSTEFVVV